MANTLIAPVELSEFPGAPYSDGMVDIAAASVRAEAGWHIAPEVTETIEVDSYGGTLLIIPSRRIVSVTEIRNMTSSAEVVTGWSRLRGGLYRRSGWPAGVLEIDLTHGYATTPEDLKPILAARARNATDPRDPSLAQKTTTRGPFTDSETYRDGAASTVDPTIARYAVLAGVA